ncbi:MAG: hypothetical protein PVF55_06220 [Desulfobacterales bacterium]|jgi:hypothetical protein
MGNSDGDHHATPPPSVGKLFAWAGLRFRLPAGWETGQLGADHGWLESDFKPVLEFKTAIVKGRFSFRRQLKQLAQESPLQVQLEKLPVSWRSHLTAFETQAFSWQGPRVAGTGIVLYCPDCHRVTLMQFYRTGASLSAFAPVLASFDDHGPGRRPTVAVYDLQVTVPPTLPLKRFRFDSGRFELVFGTRRRQVTLWRWSPADAALRYHGGSLSNFAGQNGLPSDPPVTSRRFRQGREWRWGAMTPWKDRLKRRIQRRLPPQAFRIWHQTETNRILAARWDGAWDRNRFEEICSSYEIIS